MLGDREVPPVEGRQRVEALGTLGPRQIVEQRHTEEGPAPSAGIVLEHFDETIRIRIWQGPQEHPVHHAEDGGVRADAQRQCQNRCERQDRRAPPRPPGVSHVLYERRDLLPGGGARQIGDERQPDAGRPFTAHAVAIEVRHLGCVVVGEVARVQAQQPLDRRARRSCLWPSVRAPRYARPGANPTAFACRSRVVRRAASACATDRPNGVIR